MLVVVLATCGCSSGLPRPFVSPLPEPLATVQPMRRAYFLPGLVRAPSKLGMGGCPVSCEAFGCSWCYAWSTTPGRLTGVETVPMIRDLSMVEWQIGGNSAWVLGFNEPDLCPWQACLTPEAAVWPTVRIEERFPDRKLVAPAPSSQHVEWLPQFREAFHRATGRHPRWDALAAHCYLWTADRCIELVKLFVGWCELWGVPELWVTEFAFVPAWAADPEAEARKFTAYLESEPRVTRYAPFLSHGGGCDPFWPDCRPEADPSLLEADLMTPTVMGGWYAQPAPGWN